MSWEELKSIADEARAWAEQERNTPPTACPQCGEPLLTGPHGELRCPADGWTWMQ